MKNINNCGLSFVDELLKADDKLIKAPDIAIKKFESMQSDPDAGSNYPAPINKKDKVDLVNNSIQDTLSYLRLLKSI